MHAIDPAFISETQEFWGRRLGRDVTAGEAEEAIRVIGDFFRLLAKWDQAAGQQPAMGD